MIHRLLLWTLLTSFGICYCADDSDIRPFVAPLLAEEKKEIPWMVGNIFTPSGFVVPPGHFKIQPTLLTRSSHSSYSNHWHSTHANNLLTIDSNFLFKFGVAKFMDLFVRLQSTYNRTSDVSTFGFGDLVCGTDLQLYTYPPDSWLPAVKLVLLEFFPTGQYQKLNPSKKRTDAIGRGSYTTEIGLAASHLYQIQDIHYLDVRLDTFVRLSTPTHVQGLNSYGGTSDTHGTVYPGTLIRVGSGLQYSLSKHWTLATDLRYEYRFKTRFKGIDGAQIPSSDRLFIAPQIEYGWTSDIGAVIGSWFTLAGRNSRCFYGGIARFAYYY